LRIELDSFAALCGSALFYRKGRKGFAKRRKEEVLDHETEPVLGFALPNDRATAPISGELVLVQTKGASSLLKGRGAKWITCSRNA
jgi:hypothetical protein